MVYILLLSITCLFFAGFLRRQMDLESLSHEEIEQLESFLAFLKQDNDNCQFHLSEGNWIKAYDCSKGVSHWHELIYKLLYKIDF